MVFNSKVTIYKRNLSHDGISWEKEEFDACIYKKNGIDLTAANDSTNNYIIIRILSDTGICKPGDRVAIGSYETSMPAEDAYVITAVTENFKGSREMHHVKIQAE